MTIQVRKTSDGTSTSAGTSAALLLSIRQSAQQLCINVYVSPANYTISLPRMDINASDPEIAPVDLSGEVKRRNAREGIKASLTNDLKLSKNALVSRSNCLQQDDKATLAMIEWRIPERVNQNTDTKDRKTYISVIERFLVRVVIETQSALLR